MILHENRLLADDSRQISYLIFSKIGKDVAKFVVNCSCDWRLGVRFIFQTQVYNRKIQVKFD